MIRITVPIDSRLHAHAKGGKFSKTAATKQARQLGKMLAFNQPAIRGQFILDIEITVPDRRHRDTLNMCQSVKPYIDGVVDAKKIDGDYWEVLRVGNITVKLGDKLQAELTFFGVQP